MHGTLGPFFFIVLTPAVTRGFGFISFKLKVPALHKATAIDKRLAGRALTQSNPNRAFFLPKNIGKQGNIRQYIQTEGVFQATHGTCKDAKIHRQVN